MNDQDIIALYFDRNENAVKETSDKYGKYCFSIAYNILQNEADANESVNDTYFSAWNCIPPHRPTVLSAFLGKITRNISLKRWRDMHAQKRGAGEITLVYNELAECVPSDTDIDAELEAKEIAVCIDNFLQTLSDTERRVFVCRYWYFDSISAICEQFGFSESKIKSMLFRMRNKLMKKLKKEGVYFEK